MAVKYVGDAAESAADRLRNQVVRTAPRAANTPHFANPAQGAPSTTVASAITPFTNTREDVMAAHPGPQQFSSMSPERFAQEVADRERARGVMAIRKPESVGEGAMKVGMGVLPGGAIVNLMARAVQSMTAQSVAEESWKRSQAALAAQPTAEYAMTGGMQDVAPHSGNVSQPGNYGPTAGVDYRTQEERNAAGGASEGGGTVICSLMYERGLIDNPTYMADQRFGRYVSPETLDGYHLWAKPLARAMRSHPWLFAFVAWFAVRWAKEMQNVMFDGLDAVGDGSWVGLALMLVGLPICWGLGWSRRLLQEIIP